MNEPQQRIRQCPDCRGTRFQQVGVDDGGGFRLSIRNCQLCEGRGAVECRPPESHTVTEKTLEEMREAGL